MTSIIESGSFPQSIRELTEGRSFAAENIGKSSASVLLYDDMALKIEPTGVNSDREHEIMLWLRDRLPVPKVLAFERFGGLDYLLMSRLDGEMACSDVNIAQPEKLIKSLAAGLRLLWSVDISSCPVVNGLDAKLKAARFNLDNSLVDLDDIEESTLGEGGFADMEQLYRWLLSHRPQEESVFSHGDYCLPNVFIKDGEVTGFLDLGNAGIADRWQDIALCIRSMGYNLSYLNKCGKDELEKYRKLLFTHLGIEPDEEKIRYYILLDEFF